MINTKLGLLRGGHKQMFRKLFLKRAELWFMKKQAEAELGQT